MRGRCVRCDREYINLLTHLETEHADLFGGEKFARHPNGDPVIITAGTPARVEVVNLDHLTDLAIAALPYWDRTSFEVWSTGDGTADDQAVHAFMANLSPAALLLLIDQARKGAAS